jgi:hypothetical protein
MKTLKQTSMLYGPDATSYMCDFYHGLGWFYLVEDGLFHSGTSKATETYVSPEHHK